MGRKISGEALLQRSIRRQDVLKTGADYDAGIHAVRGEAPNISTATRLFVPRLGRSLHLLSGIELLAAVVALFHTDVVEVFDQLVLWPDPRPNPIAALTGQIGTLPGLPGTVTAAAELGLTSHIPTFVAEKDDDVFRVPLPFFGDLLLILKDQNTGTHWAVNWSVKKSERDFSRAIGRRPLRRESDKARAQAEARHSIEVSLFAAAGIPTFKITKTTFHPTLVENLHRVFLNTVRQEALQADQIDRLAAMLRAALGAEPPCETLSRFCVMESCSRSAALLGFYRLLWTQRLKIDWTRPILTNVPLTPANVDPLAAYAALFGEDQ